MTLHRSAWILVSVGMLVPTSQQPTFKSGVDLVRVDVLVVRGGRPVLGLTAADFEVFDSGAPQQIERVSFEETPVDVLMVFDTSRSVAGEKLLYLREAAQAFLQGLKPGDRAGVVSFSHHVKLISDLTGNLSSLPRALDTLNASGSTSLLDALYAALLLPTRPEARRLVLLFSDGLDNTSWLSERDVLQVVRESDGVVYSVGVRPTRDQGARTANNALLEDLAAETGGRLFLADSGQRLREVFVRVVQEMKARYLLTYYPHYPPGASREGWHSLRIRLKGKAGDVIARRGYYVATK